MTSEILAEEKQRSIYLLDSQERVEQVECGSIHTLVRTSFNRLFSCGNGATFALGHGNKETLRTFRQIQFFNGSDPEQTQVSGVSIRTIACGMVHSGCVLSDGTLF